MAALTKSAIEWINRNRAQTGLTHRLLKRANKTGSARHGLKPVDFSIHEFSQLQDLAGYSLLKDNWSLAKVMLPWMKRKESVPVFVVKSEAALAPTALVKTPEQLFRIAAKLNSALSQASLSGELTSEDSENSQATDYVI